MLHPRTIDQLYEQHRASDPNTALTRRALRSLVVSGAIPSIRVGTKYLVTEEALDAFLAGGEIAHCGAIRPVGR